MTLSKNTTNSKTINRFQTLEDEFHKKHHHKYNYDLFIYSGSHQKSIIICPRHGNFEQNPTNHLQGKGCDKCAIEYRAENSIQKRKEKFIEDAKIIHGNTYDYSKTVYNGSEKNCIFICKIHGEFQQLPLNHLKGKGCKKCGYISMAKKQSKINKENFVEKVSQLHNHFYDYSKFKYISNRTKGIVMCPKHGEFEQTPVHHFNRKQGCPKCGDESMAQKQSEEARKNFKSKASKLHDNLYIYSKFEYINSSTKSIIYCTKCLKEFKQTPEDHLSGSGCPNCKTKRDNNVIYIWKAIGEFYNDKQLYKIGVTSSRLRKNRIVQVAGKLKWDFEIILLENVICEARELEKHIHKIGTNPNLKGFDGATELRAFSEDELIEAINTVKPYIKK
jgi:hypothetical protein